MRLLILLICFGQPCFSQTYHPAAGAAGTSAMHKDSSAFVAWATGCTVQRGLQDISNPGSGLASVGDQSMATGKSQGNVVSLGDGGTATCTFLKPITNGAGYDFAVFENSIDNSFLELGLVEVSSNGTDFFRFASHSLTDTTTQTLSFGTTDPTRINNLAGKYRANYGTPFDLQELQGKPGLDINAVTHVRIIDVVGTMQNQYATRDSHGNKINDPWPTAFPSGGFDLDAVGVIHESAVSSVRENKLATEPAFFPNPVTVGKSVYLTGLTKASLYRMDGKKVKEVSGEFETGDLAPGVYFIYGLMGERQIAQKLVVEGD